VPLKSWLATLCGSSCRKRSRRNPYNPLHEKMKERWAGGKYVREEDVERKPVLDDGEAVFSQTRGDDYASFWTNVATSRDGALMSTRTLIIDDETDYALSVDLAEMIYQALQLNEQSHILEVGCGMGSMSYHIVGRVARHVMADISPTMLEHARKRIGDAPAAEYHLLEACDLKDFEDNSFDGVFFEAVLEHLDREDAYRYMRETLRVIRPGGRAYFMVFSLLHPKGFSEFETVVDHMCDGRGKNLVTRNRYYTSSEIRAYLNNIGFKIDESCSQLSDEPPDVLVHIDEHALVAVCEKPADA